MLSQQPHAGEFPAARAEVARRNRCALAFQPANITKVYQREASLRVPQTPKHIGCHRGIGYARRRRKGPRAAVLQNLKMDLFIPHARCTLLQASRPQTASRSAASRRHVGAIILRKAKDLLRPPGHRSQVFCGPGFKTTKAPFVRGVKRPKHQTEDP